MGSCFHTAFRFPAARQQQNDHAPCRRQQRSWRTLLATVSVCLFLTACSSSDMKPERQLSEVEAAITEAESAGARMADPVLLNQAQSKLSMARDQIDKEQYEDAERTLSEARAEAQLAKARAETLAIKRAAEEMETSINMLRQQINNSGGSGYRNEQY